MKIRLKAVWLGAPMALIGSMITPAMADEWNKKTEFEFSGPVEVPGKVLDAGKYVFQLLDSQDRNIVQIFSVDPEGNQRLVTTIMAVPDYLLNAPDKPIIHFEERRGDSPEFYCPRQFAALSGGPKDAVQWPNSTIGRVGHLFRFRNRNDG